MQAETLTRQPNAKSARELLTARDLEAMLKIDVKTIYMYVQKGLIPYVRIQSNVRFVREEILDWIEKQSYRPKGLGSISKPGLTSHSLNCPRNGNGAKYRQ